MIVVVPGTWWRSKPAWAAAYHPDAMPMRRAAALFDGEPILFPWSGANSPRARHAAASALADFLAPARSPIHLIGFSHGGNIASEAAALLDSPVDTLVTIATPVSGRYRTGGALRHLHLYSDRDLTQRGGGEWIRLPGFGSIGWAGRTYGEAAGARNIPVRVPAGRGWSGRHGDILWTEGAWLSLAEILRP